MAPELPPYARVVLEDDARQRVIRARFPGVVAVADCVFLGLALATAMPMVTSSCPVAGDLVFTLLVESTFFLSVYAIDVAARSGTAHPLLRRAVVLQDAVVAESAYRSPALTRVLVNGRTHALSDGLLVVTHWHDATRARNGDTYGVQLAFPEVAYELASFVERAEALALASAAAKLLNIPAAKDLIDHVPFVLGHAPVNGGPRSTHLVGLIFLCAFLLPLFAAWATRSNPWAYVATVLGFMVLPVVLRRPAGLHFRKRAEASGIDLLARIAAARSSSEPRRADGSPSTTAEV